MRLAQVNLCICGCGETVKSGNSFVFNHHRRGSFASEETKQKMSELSLGKPKTLKHRENISKSKIGEKNPAWKGGRKLHNGYIVIWKPDHPFAMKGGIVSEHRLILEEYLGRYLEKGETRDFDEIPHHIDENKQNNDIENLELCLYGIHTKYHNEKRYA